MANWSNKEWVKTRKIVRMPGVRLTPETVLASSLEKAKAGHIQSIVVAIQWQDGTVDVDWSQMPMSTSTWIAKHIDRWVMSLLNGEPDLD